MSKSRDTNQLIASLLRDLASVQPSPQSKWGYKRAASAILNLDSPIEAFVRPDGTLGKIKHIGPSSTRIILEVLRQGSSPTVQQAVAASGRGSEVEKRRDWRSNFLALDSDAHSPDQLDYAEIALAHARLAAVPKSRVINTWPIDRLFKWAGTRRAAQ
jgi:hypothetical protein